MTDDARQSVPTSRQGGVLARAIMAAGLLFGLGAAVVLLTASGPGDAPKRPESTELVPAEIMSFEISTTASGELEARSQLELRSELESNTTIEFIVPEGTVVEKGELLARLKSDAIKTEIEEDILQAEAAKQDLASAQAAYQIQLSENESRLRDAKLQVELAELALKQWIEGDDVKKQKQLELAVEKAEREQQRLTDLFKRSQQLFERGFLSKDQRDRDETNMIEAEANVVTTRLDLDIYRDYQRPRDEKSKRSDLEERHAALDRTQEQNEINLANRQSEVTSRERRLLIREERLEREREQLAACEITAPQGGLVVYGTSLQENRWRGGDSGPFQVGSQVSPNQLLMVLPDTSEMIASVRVHESLAGRIRPGQLATVQIDAAGGGRYEGVVDSIGVLAESGGWRDPNRREYTVKVAIEGGNPGRLLKPSMRCTAKVLLDEVEDSLAVPLQAVFTDGPIKFVYVPSGSRFEKRPISVGRRSDLYAEIRKGLNEGDLVLVREPQAGEIVNKPWDPKQLETIGIKLDENGRPIPQRPEGVGRRMGRAGGATATPAAQTTRGSKPDAKKTNDDEAEVSDARESAPATAASAPGTN